MQENSLPELLAPAGSIKSFKAAVNAGADAVYLSGKKFGARHYAANFKDQEMEDAINYAHLHGAKVYVTVNILIKDCELPQVAKYLFWLYKSGADAIIVQDLGVAGLCREIVPDLNIHASTQMTIHNLDGVIWAANFGFKRVTLSREVGVQDIKKISQKLKESEGDRSFRMELEVFGHGALCYSYSGLCLMSSFIGGRSGNRGMCAQPCRKPYKLVTGIRDKFGKPTSTSVLPLKEHYLLSTRDLSVYRRLNEIVETGVNSIKLEGRMRSPEYVAAVVGIYRKALNAIKRGTWKPTHEDISKLKLAFNRGFTEGYILNAGCESVMGRDAPGNRGLYVGDVVSSNHEKSIVKVKDPILPEKGDGIVFRSLNSEEADRGMFVEYPPIRNGDKIILKVRKPVKVGCKLFITHKKSLMDSANRLIKETSKSVTPISLHLRWDEKLVPDVECEFPMKTGKKDDHLLFHYKAPFPFEPAIKHPLSPAQIKKQLKKAGETPFTVINIEMEYPGNLFVPISKLNQMRRDILKKAEEKLLKSYQPAFNKVKAAEIRLNNFLNYSEGVTSNLKSKSEKSSIEAGKQPVSGRDRKETVLGVYADDLKTLEAACKGGCSHVYFEPCPTYFNPLNFTFKENDPKKYFKYIFNSLKKAGTICRDKNVDLVWKLPSIIQQSHVDHLNPLIKKISDLHIFKVMIDDLGAVESFKRMDPSIELYGAAGLNVWNHQTVKQLSNQNPSQDETSKNLKLKSDLKGLTVSPELSGYDVKSLISNSRLRNITSSFELLVQGNIEMMVTKDSFSLFKSHLKTVPSRSRFTGIEDVKKRVFPVNTDPLGQTHILNSVELCLVDYLPSIIDMGIDSIVIDTRSKTPAYAFEMASIYSDALKSISNNVKGLEKILKCHKNRIKKISTGGITTGNFLKGVNGD